MIIVVSGSQQSGPPITLVVSSSASGMAVSGSPQSIAPITLVVSSSAPPINVSVPSFVSHAHTSDTSGFAQTASFAVTAAYAQNFVGGNASTASYAYTASVALNAVPYNSGTFTGSFTGSLLGTASFAISSSWAPNSKTILTQTQNYYVRTDGSNLNTGLANTSNQAWQTVQYAVDWITEHVDSNGQYVVLNIANGDYGNAIVTKASNVSLIIQGNSSNYRSVKLSSFRLTDQAEIPFLQLSDITVGEVALYGQCSVELGYNNVINDYTNFSLENRLFIAGTVDLSVYGNILDVQNVTGSIYPIFWVQGAPATMIFNPNSIILPTHLTVPLTEAVNGGVILDFETYSVTGSVDIPVSAKIGSMVRLYDVQSLITGSYVADSTSQIIHRDEPNIVSGTHTPESGSQGQALVKISDASYHIGWSSIVPSASFATSASYAPDKTFPYTGVAVVTGTLQTTNKVISNQYQLDSTNGIFVITGSVQSGIFGVTENILPVISTGSFSGVTIEYMAQRPGGIRLGMIMGAWSASQYTFTDISTTDIGDTSDIVTGFLPVGPNIIFQVHSAGSGSSTWTVQSLFKLFPNLN